LFSNLRFDDESWSRWNSTNDCELHFPDDKHLTGFQQLLVIQAFRPDRLESAMKQFVCDLLGIKDISPETLNLRKLYTKETISTEPILIITSAGADPSAELRDLAIEITGKDRYAEVKFEGHELISPREKNNDSILFISGGHGSRSDGDRS
jgi:dynein heavy chain 2, cytosolic